MIMPVIRNIWRNLQIFVLTQLLPRISLINIGITATHAVLQVAQAVVLFVQEDATKVIKLCILERVISSVTVGIKENAKV